MYRFNKLIVKFSTYYHLDIRALALMRVALGLVILVDLFIRGSDLLAFYGDNGLWPAKLVEAFSGKPGMWSLCTLFEGNWWIILLYSLNVIFAFTFLIGYKTKLSNLLLWLLTLSFHNRNIFILQAGDDLLRLLLFWGLFLPWHLHYTIDRNSKSILLNNFLAKLAYLVLIASVYFFSANLKSSGEWFSEASAIYYTLSLDVFKTSLGHWLYLYPGLMSILTRLTLITEYLIPLLILMPSKKGTLRFMAFILVLVLHIGFGLFLNVGLFFIISIVASIGLLPANVMNKFQHNSIKHLKTFHHAPQKYISILRNSMVLTCVLICLVLNLSYLNWFDYQLKKEMMWPVNFLRLDQFWGMFSPSIPKQNSWLVYQAYNTKGQQYDIQKNAEYVDFNKPNDFSRLFTSDRWRKLAENIGNDHYSFLRPHYCKYLLKKWNSDHKENKMSTLNLYSMSETTLADYQKVSPEKKILCVCDEH